MSEKERQLRKAALEQKALQRFYSVKTQLEQSLLIKIHEKIEEFEAEWGVAVKGVNVFFIKDNKSINKRNLNVSHLELEIE